MATPQNYDVGKIVSTEYDESHSRIGLPAKNLSELGLNQVLKEAMQDASLKYPILNGVTERYFVERPSGEGCLLYEPVQIEVNGRTFDAQVYNAYGEYWKGIDDSRAIIISAHLAKEANLSEGDPIDVVKVLEIGNYYKDSDLFKEYQEQAERQAANRD